MKSLIRNISLIADSGLPVWVTDSFPIIRMVIMIALVVLSAALIVVVLMQKSNSGGMGALDGSQTDTFYAKNKGKTLAGVLKRLTFVIGVAIFVLCILFFVTVIIYPVSVA